MKFFYRGFDKNGKKVKGVIEAVSQEEARSKLSHLPVILELKPKSGLRLPGGRVKKGELARILTAIGLYLKSSIPLKRAISLAKNQTTNTRLQKFLTQLEVEIGEGKGFSEALSSQKWLNLPPYLLHSVQVGESSGKLDLILLQTAQFLEEEERISSQSTQALIYPTFIISVSLILVIVMMGSVVPKIVKIFQDLHQKLPPITQFTISVSHFFQNHGVAVGIAILGTIFGIGVLYKKFLPFRRRIDGLLLKIPVINRLIISKNLGRFSYLTHTLTSAGVNFVNALNLASKTIDNRILAELFHDALEEVLEGKKISTALKKRNFPDLPFVESLGLVEETGEASSILESLSRLYLDEYRNRTTLLLSLLEPVMILIVGGIIGFIVISMLLPIFQMNVLGGG